MANYSVKPVVCDYGLFEGDELKLICNSYRNAHLIKAILDKDSLCNKKDYYFKLEDMTDFIIRWYRDTDTGNV